jgi:hypothetical protein
MAKIVLDDAYVEIESNNISNWVASVTVATEVAEVSTTAMGDSAQTRVAGLKDNSVSIDFHQDFAASEVESIIYPLIGTLATVKVRPTSAAKSATNPEYTGEALVTSWSPVTGAVGELLTISVTWPVSGEWAKATS